MNNPILPAQAEMDCPALFRHNGNLAFWCPPPCNTLHYIDEDEWGDDEIDCPACDETWTAEDWDDMAGANNNGDGGGRVITRIIVHCAATPPSMDIGAAEIRRWHTDKGWSDLGYHRVIRRDGEIEAGRPESKSGAHARGFNDDSLAVCLVGGVDEYNDPEANFTPAQWNSLRVLIARWMREHPSAEVCGHRDLPGVNKACPSFDVKTWLAVAFSQEDAA